MPKATVTVEFETGEHIAFVVDDCEVALKKALREPHTSDEPTVEV